MADIDLPSSESEGELEPIKKDEEEEPKEFRPHVSVLAPQTSSPRQLLLGRQGWCCICK